MAEKTLSNYLDTIGALASTACAVHCLLTPFFIGILPLLGIGFLAADWFEDLVVVGAIVLGVVSLGHGYMHHHQVRVFWLLLCGIALLVSGRWLVGYHSKIVETLMVVAGGAAVAGAHWFNRRLCQSCEACQHS